MTGGALGARDLRRGEQVRAPATGAVQDQQVTLRHQCLDLPGEGLLEAEVVARRGQQATSVPSATAAYARRSGCLWRVAHDVLSRTVLRIGGAATVAGEVERAAIRGACR